MLWGPQLGRDENIGRCLPGFHHPRLSEKRIATSVFVIAFVFSCVMNHTIAERYCQYPSCSGLINRSRLLQFESAGV